MTWEKTYIYQSQYEYVSSNQHGDRYKRIGIKQVNCVKLIASVNDAKDLRDLILLSHHLNVPVHYDFKTDPQTAYIEVAAKEGILV